MRSGTSVKTPVTTSAGRQRARQREEEGISCHQSQSGTEDRRPGIVLSVCGIGISAMADDESFVHSVGCQKQGRQQDLLL